ncbi:MAG: hypothetical protein ACREOB_08685, partial [Thermodesulfobacteriota bacterium]
MALTVGTGINRGAPRPSVPTYRSPRVAERAPAPRPRPPVRSPVRPSTPYRPPSGSSGSSGYRSTSGSAPSGVPAARPGIIPTLAKFLAGDVGYQQSLRGGQRTLADFLSEIGRQRGEAGTSFTQTKSQLEADRVKQLEMLENEYASRGLLMSGLYGEAQGDFQEQFQNQMTQLQQAQTSLLNDLLGQETNFRREQQLAAELARQEA